MIMTTLCSFEDCSPPKMVANSELVVKSGRDRMRDSSKFQFNRWQIVY